MKFKIYFEPMIVEFDNYEDFEETKFTTSIIEKIEELQSKVEVKT